MAKQSVDLEKQSRLQAKAAGKSKFIRRQMLGGLLFWLVLIPALDLFVFKASLLSVSMLRIDLIMLPVLLLGAYLEGAWRWKDLKEKHSE